MDICEDVASVSSLTSSSENSDSDDEEALSYVYLLELAAEVGDYEAFKTVYYESLKANGYVPEPYNISPSRPRNWVDAKAHFTDEIFLRVTHFTKQQLYYMCVKLDVPEEVKRPGLVYK